MNVIVGEWSELSMDERLRVLEFYVWEREQNALTSGVKGVVYRRENNPVID